MIDLLPMGSDEVAGCEPILETMAGREDSTIGATSLDQLPQDCAGISGTNRGVVRSADRHCLDRTGAGRDDSPQAPV